VRYRAHKLKYQDRNLIKKRYFRICGAGSAFITAVIQCKRGIELNNINTYQVKRGLRQLDWSQSSCDFLKNKTNEQV